MSRHGSLDLEAGDFSRLRAKSDAKSSSNTFLSLVILILIVAIAIVWSQDKVTTKKSSFKRGPGKQFPVATSERSEPSEDVELQDSPESQPTSSMPGNMWSWVTGNPVYATGAAVATALMGGAAYCFNPWSKETPQTNYVLKLSPFAIGGLGLVGYNWDGWKWWKKVEKPQSDSTADESAHSDQEQAPASEAPAPGIFQAIKSRVKNLFCKNYDYKKGRRNNIPTALGNVCWLASLCQLLCHSGFVDRFQDKQNGKYLIARCENSSCKKKQCPEVECTLEEHKTNAAAEHCQCGDRWLLPETDEQTELAHQLRKWLGLINHHVQGIKEDVDINNTVKGLARKIEAGAPVCPITGVRPVEYGRQNDSSEALMWLIDNLRVPDGIFPLEYGNCLKLDKSKPSDIIALKFLEADNLSKILDVHTAQPEEVIHADPDNEGKSITISGRRITFESVNSNLHLYNFGRFGPDISDECGPGRFPMPGETKTVTDNDGKTEKVPSAWLLCEVGEDGNPDPSRIINKKDDREVSLPATLTHKFGRTSERTLRLKTVVQHIGSTIRSGHYVTWLWLGNESNEYMRFSDGSSAPTPYPAEDAEKEFAKGSYMAMYEDVTTDAGEK